MTVMREQFVPSLRSQGLRPSGLPPLRSRPAGERRTEAQQRQLVLARAIETLVIPRLVEAHREAPQPGGFAAAARSGVLTAESVEEFARLILENEVPTAALYLADMRARGAAMEALYLDLLAPAARYLGELWKEDLCDFVQVTTGLWRLQQVLHGLSESFRAETVSLDPTRHVLLVPAPGEQHTFGLVIVAEFFRRAGWSVWSGTPESASELLAMVRAEWFGVVGFSTACEIHLDSLGSSIRQVRRASRNRSLGVMVGGPLFAANPALADELGADATAADGREAVAEAGALLARLQGEEHGLRRTGDARAFARS